MFFFFFRLFMHLRPVSKRRATAVSNSIDRIWHGSGTTFETI